jgi:hypothetical protein
MELDNLQHVIKHLTIEIIDIKRNYGEITSTQCLHRPFFKKPIPPKHMEPPRTNLNIDMEGVAMENFCNYHQENHLEKTCPQWINAMNMIANHFMDECIQTKESSDNVNGEIEEELEEQPKKIAMVL